MSEDSRPHRCHGLRPWIGLAAVAGGLIGASGLLASCSPSNSTPEPESTGIVSVAPPATASPTPAATPAPKPTPKPTPTPTPKPTPLPMVSIHLTQVVAGLASPVGVVAAGDDRLFVIGRTGRVEIVRNGTIAGTFLDISARISTNHTERGLLGLAFHPGYATNGRFFVRYTDTRGDVRVSEFHVSSNPNKADPASEKVLLTISHPTNRNHNGGTIAFGPDGYLYVGTGDGGGVGDPQGNGQNLNVLPGKLLRLDVDSGSPGTSTIPADNPFAESTGKRGEIWAYGLRNPYAFSFDRATGDLWIADVGQNTWEEVDRATAATDDGRGFDFGWSVMEGRHCYRPASGCKTEGLVQPIAEYTHGPNDSTGCSIIGGFVYRGTAHPELVGRYFFGDYCSGKIWDLAADGPDSQTPQLLLRSGLRITGWGEGHDGNLYVVSETTGRLYRMD